jgi:hypothetical protein
MLSILQRDPPSRPSFLVLGPISADPPPFHGTPIRGAVQSSLGYSTATLKAPQSLEAVNLCEPDNTPSDISSSLVISSIVPRLFKEAALIFDYLYF